MNSKRAFGEKLALLFAMTNAPRPADGGYFGCPVSAHERAGKQQRARDVYAKLLALSPYSFKERNWQSVPPELDAAIQAVMNDASDTALLQHQPSQADTVTHFMDQPLPCVPGVVFAEFLELLWVWRVEFDVRRAKEFLDIKFKLFSWLRIQPWHELINLGYGMLHAAVCPICGLAPESGDSFHFDTNAMPGQFDLPGIVATSTTIFHQYHVLTGFDYRACVQRFMGLTRNGAPLACAAPGLASLCSIRGQFASRSGTHSALWPHSEFISLSARQPFACGTLCRYASAFALVAQALLLRKASQVNRGRRSRSSKLSADEQALLQAAQREIAVAEPVFWGLTGALQVVQSCSLARSFPFWAVLGWLACVPSVDAAEDGPKSAHSRTYAAPSYNQSSPPPQTPPRVLVNHHDLVTVWPPGQALTKVGSLALHYVLHAVGTLFDSFGVRWWASAGTLLGAVRHGGLMPQELDVDIAIWRPDAHHLVAPEFRSALAAVGISSYHMPLYFLFRFCLASVPAGIGRQSADGKLGCSVPFLDGHLADVAPQEQGRWHYIHQTDLQYAGTFPLSGVLHPLANGSFVDMRQSGAFGDHTQIWLPQSNETQEYLTILYGADWRTVMRGRHGNLVHNDTEFKGRSFWGLTAKPTGPLRDVFGELKAFNILEPAGGSSVSSSPLTMLRDATNPGL